MPTTDIKHPAYLDFLNMFLNFELRKTSCWQHGLRATIREDRAVIDFRYRGSLLFQSGYHVLADDPDNIDIVKIVGSQIVQEECLNQAWSLSMGTFRAAKEIMETVAICVEEDSWISQIERDLWL